MACNETDAGNQVGCNHPTSAAQVGRRLDAIILLFQTKKAAADVAGISPDQMARYVKGQNAAPFEVLPRLARAKDISLDWLATGEGPMCLGNAAQHPPAADPGPRRRELTEAELEDLTEAIFEGVAGVYADAKVELRPGQVGKISAKIFCDLVRDFAPEDHGSAMRGMFSQLRRQLAEAATPPASVTDETKRRA